MCCRNKYRYSSGGCYSRRGDSKNNNNLSYEPVIYERRPTLIGMLTQHIADKREAKRQQRSIAYEPAAREASFEDEKMAKERRAQAAWDEKNMGVRAGAEREQGQGGDYTRQSWTENRMSRFSVGTQLPSYGQAMKQ